MSSEMDQMDTEHKELAAKVKRMEASNNSNDSESRRVDELEEKHTKLSEQVITEQIKTRYFVR